MPETPELHDRITKMQKDVEELREDRQDDWHLNKAQYEKMIGSALQGDFNSITLYLQIDGNRSIKEIEENLSAEGHKISHVTLWRASQKLIKSGLIRKVGAKGNSPIFGKKRWAVSLHMDDYVRTKILKKENTV